MIEIADAKAMHVNRWTHAKVFRRSPGNRRLGDRDAGGVGRDADVRPTPDGAG